MGYRSIEIPQVLALEPMQSGPDSTFQDSHSLLGPKQVFSQVEWRRAEGS